MMELSGTHHDPPKGKKKDKTQILLVGGTAVLIVLGYLALKKNGGGGGSAATPTQTGAESGGTTSDETSDQSRWDALSGKIADLSSQITGLKNSTTPVSPTPPTGPGVPAVHPVASGSTTLPGSALRKIVTKPVTAGKRAPSVQPAAGGSASSRAYTVKQGDTLSAIAKQFGTTWQKLYEANQTTIKTTATTHGQFNAADPGHWIYGGEKLVIPGSPASKGGSTNAQNAPSKVAAKTTVPVTKAHPTPKG